MRYKYLILLLISSVFFQFSCRFLSNSVKYYHTSRKFLDALINRDYEKCLTFVDSLEEYSEYNQRLLGAFDQIRDLIIGNLGTDIKYKFLKTKKVLFSSHSEEPVKTTTLLLQASNDKIFTVLKFTFNDQTGKIRSIYINEVRPIPQMWIYWLFGIFPLSVLAFNIYVIVKIKKSDLPNKWLKYLAVIFINVPTIAFSIKYGLRLYPINFQIFLGFSFGYFGYYESYWAFGIPLGGLMVLWRLKKHKKSLANKGVEVNT